jgi:hypothetical protein
MRYYDLRYFFVERLVELYARDSIDSYRVRCHNAFSLIKELRDVTESWVKGHIQDFNRVKLCTMETIEEVKADTILDFSFYNKDLFIQDIQELGGSDKNKNFDICNRVCYLMDKCISINESSYIDMLYYNIYKIIKNNEELKKEDFKPIVDKLDYQTTSLACALINEGYSQNHLYKKSHDLLDDIENFDEAFYQFKNEHNYGVDNKTYDVVFKLRGSHNEKLLNIDGFLADIPIALVGNNPNSGMQNFANIRGNWIFFHRIVEAHDSVMAIAYAKEMMDTEIDKAVLGYSTLDVIPYRKALVVVQEKDRMPFRMIRSMRMLDPTYADDDNIAKLMVKKVQAIIKSNHISPDVHKRLRSALRHLRMGNSETDAGQQLVNYWVALEFLFSSPRAEDSTILRLEKNLTNVLTCTYVKRRFEYLNEKLVKEKILSNKEKWWKLSVEDLDILINRQNSLLMKHHLMQMKANLYGNSDKVKKYLNKHRDHLVWQIYRTYRFRNQLIHEAAILPGLENVIRFLHFYLVYMLNQMIGYFTNSSLNSLNMDTFFYEYIQIYNLISHTVAEHKNSPLERIKVFMDVPLYYELIKKV